jgi:hypothetical protein
MSSTVRSGWASSVPRPVAQQVGYLHPPPDVLQIFLEPPPGQLAGLHPVEDQDGPVLRHTVIQTPVIQPQDVNTRAPAHCVHPDEVNHVVQIVRTPRWGLPESSSRRRLEAARQ